MDCITFQKLIPEYMKDSLSDEQLNGFLNHLRGCKRCSDELEIYYIVSKSVDILDRKNSNFDLKSSFQQAITECIVYIEKKKLKKRFRFAIDTLVFWACVFSLLIFYYRIYRA